MLHLRGSSEDTGSNDDFARENPIARMIHEKTEKLRILEKIEKAREKARDNAAKGKFGKVADCAEKAKEKANMKARERLRKICQNIERRKVIITLPKIVDT